MAVDHDFERTIYQGNRAAAPPPGSLFETYADRVMRRVEDALDGRGCKWPLTPQQRTFLESLRRHQGKQRSVPLGAIAERMHLTVRGVKDLVQELRQNFGIQLGASREAEGGGYYLIATEAESIESTAQMFAQAITMLRVVAAMRGGREAIALLLSQISLELDTEETDNVR